MTDSVKIYQAKILFPFAVLGIIIEEEWLTDIEYLPLDTPLLAPKNSLAKEVCNQLTAYLTEPSFTFDLNLHIGGTTHQRRVWNLIKNIPCGKQPVMQKLPNNCIRRPELWGERVALIDCRLSYRVIVLLQKMAV